MQAGPDTIEGARFFRDFLRDEGGELRLAIREKQDLDGLSG